ncbi:MAG: M20 family metallopeptidase [Anaerovoracaceae bacterium]|nr:M20 family metallopeptidase [Bacillota bacterium]MDY2670299.1 M20 family metallopeptidase [Anaerovoracaceae bacterium]
MSIEDLIKEKYEQHRDEIIEIRRRLHENPETGDEEYDTTEYLCGLMEKLGLRVGRPLKTGLTAVLDVPDRGGYCIGLRADIDALPIKEGCDLPFKSKRDGVMHACGHDIHTASLVGAAIVLSDPEVREHLTAPVKFVFQPAEETDGGAQRMIDKGVLENPHVDRMAAFHCEPSLEAGKIALKYGYTRASSDMFDIMVRGESAHGAYPETGVDAIVAASAVVTAVQSIVSRNTNAFEPCVITIGVFHAGSAGNVVCDDAFLSGTMRTVSPEVRANSMKRLEEIAVNTAAAYGAKAEVRFRPSYMALLNDDQMTELLRDTAEKLIGKENVVIYDKAMMSVDDFSYFAKEVPSVYFFAGSGFEDRKNYSLHHGLFEADEKLFDTTVPLEALAVIEMEKRG